MRLLPKGFAQLLPIVQWLVGLNLGYIEEAARGTLAYVTGAPSEEEAIACVLRIFDVRYEEADREALEAFMRAQTREWWVDYPERQLLSALVRRADRRKLGIGREDGRRPPSCGEGLRIARPMLASIPKKLTLDAEGEFEAVSKLLAALLKPPMGEDSPERLQRYIEFSKSKRVYHDALRRYNQEYYSPDKTIYRPDFSWQRRAACRSPLRRAKMKVASHPPVKPALLLRNFQIQFVIGLLDRVGVPPQGTDVSGCRIVAKVLGLSEYRVKGIWEMRFTAEMRKHSKAIAKRAGLLDTTEA